MRRRIHLTKLGDTNESIDRRVDDVSPHGHSQVRAFDSGSIAAGASWRYVATKRGAFAYGCTFHPTMKGKITVQ